MYSNEIQLMKCIFENNGYIKVKNFTRLSKVWYFSNLGSNLTTLLRIQNNVFLKNKCENRKIFTLTRLAANVHWALATFFTRPLFTS